MNIINNHSLINSQQENLLRLNASRPFSIGKFQSLDDILTTLNVDVIIEPKIIERSIPSALHEAEKFWQEEADRWESLIRDAEDREAAKKDYHEAAMKDYHEARENNMKIREEIESWSFMPVRGLYDPVANVIKLYPEEMEHECSGAHIDELLVSTLAHETMHAYFNRPRHKSYPYVIHVEEPLAEFGMLLYLHETGSSYYHWAYNDVSSKKTCYRFGANLMDQYLQQRPNSSVRKYLEDYKVKLDNYPMPTFNSNGPITMPTINKASGKYIFKAPDNLNWLCYDHPELKAPIYWAFDEATRRTYITCTKHNYENPCSNSLYPPHLGVHSEVFVDKNVVEFLIDNRNWLRLSGSDLPSIKDMKIDHRNPRYRFDGGVLVDKHKNSIIGGLVTVDVIHIPSGPVAIEREAFFCHVDTCWIGNDQSFHPYKIKYISVPNSVRRIDRTAFIACDKTTVLILPMHLKGIGLNTNAKIIYHP